MIVRTLDGLRVALAGFPATLPVQVSEGLDLLSATTVGELRQVTELAGPIDLSIPYRILSDSVVIIKPLDWSGEGER